MIIKHIAHNRLTYICIFSLFFCGFMIGLAAPVTMTDASAEQIRNYIGNYLQMLPNASFSSFDETVRAFTMNSLLLLVIYLSGMHLLGILFIGATMGYKGFTLGYSMGFLLNYQGLSGFLVILFSLIPQNILLIPVFFYFAYIAVNNSMHIWGRQSSCSMESKNSLFSYTKIFILVLAIVLVASLIQGFICPLLLKILFIII